MLREAAENGRVDAMETLGVCFADGNGVEKDETEATAWLRRAAESNSTRAIQRLIGRLEKGIGGEPNQAEAEFWKRKESEKEIAIYLSRTEKN